MIKNGFLLLIIFLIFLGSGCFPKTPRNVAVANSKFSETKDGPANIGNIFKETDAIYLYFEIINFEQNKDKTIWVQEDLKVFGPDDKLVEWVTSYGEIKKFDYVNLVDINKKFEKKISAIPVFNSINLPTNSPVGEYKVIIDVRDKLNGTQAYKELFFKLISKS